ncbi:MAG: ATP-dependent 6-phosphofructokinase [Candidatus Electrothrix sp. LOE1_4_5]|nr:ATP-dependent 6-phosphofructokinase [Candidatus Electrothrix sp. AX1]MCI5117328.1 ATP-dependent 6-phosphofructokinase [Candidatus Electrothrix gigas]MCI5182871.1 ATP-dependent 6-phosphofructokinase [Candidatus Electrothrix gigas]MCI5189452.1 ATP-dependent 6-phosphofructokinase [Candidatus Electrothrix gigas]MCI5196388.1 ATP-dependent 6-phosphofructokinase [Candidatus Electrothrix gigas]
MNKIVISTGGGDAPGLNAVIFAVVKSATKLGWEVYGSLQGYQGFLDKDKMVRLMPADVQEITSIGGTILGTTNRGNPFSMPIKNFAGEEKLIDVSDKVMAGFRRMSFDCHIAVGGDGSLEIAHRFAEMGMPVIGVPKTIDNDLEATDRTFGFDTAVSTATEALDKLHSTAKSHDRVMVVEVMGRDSGWIALYSGICGGADVVLLPEIPFDMDAVCAKITENELHGKRYSIVVVAEGAKEEGGSVRTRGKGEAGREEVLLGGIGEWVAEEIRQRIGKDTRSLVLGHLQRGGSPTTFDRLLALRFGAAAVRFAAEGQFDRMVAWTPPTMSSVMLEDAIRCRKQVDLKSDKVLTARSIGICLGDKE